MQETQLLALTDEIYDAATGGTPWLAVGRSLKRAVGAASAWLVGQSPEAQFDVLYAGDFSPEAIRNYQAHYHSVDLWVAAAMARSGPRAPLKSFISGYAVSDAEYTRSEFYSDFGRKVGLRHVLGTVIPLGAAGTMPVGFHRPDTARPFDWDEAKRLDALLPHLRRAMQIRHHLRAAQPRNTPQAMALDAIATALLVVDSDMRVVLANAAAEELIGRTGCMAFQQRQSTHDRRRTADLVASHRDEHAALSALVAVTAARGVPGGALRLHDQGSAATVAVLVSPLPCRLSTRPEQSGRVPGQALLILRDLTRPPAPSPELLRAVFHLTRAEAEVACAVAGGTSMAAVAAARGLRLSTVKSQVKAVLAKAGARNMRDLERVLAGLAG